MHDVVDEVARLYTAGGRFALATVVGTWLSAPRQPGAAMVVAPDGEPTGSVSGGCVEGAVYELAQEVMGSGEPVLQRYGVSDDDAFVVSQQMRRRERADAIAGLAQNTVEQRDT